MEKHNPKHQPDGDFRGFHRVFYADLMGFHGVLLGSMEISWDFLGSNATAWDFMAAYLILW